MATQCPFLYNICKVPNCYGIRKVQTSQTSQNPGKKYLICQYEQCGHFQWLEEAITEPEKSISGCFKCGEIGHFMKNCPWDVSPCQDSSCNGVRRILTSKRAESQGRKFLKCCACGSFQWLVDALLKKKIACQNESKLVLDICKLSIRE